MADPLAAGRTPGPPLRGVVRAAAGHGPGSTAAGGGLPEARLTYDELDARANRLARYLIERGCGRATGSGCCWTRPCPRTPGCSPR
ncbi:hypothetical protein NKH77_01875 [Streptomyces sp. M19]